MKKKYYLEIILEIILLFGMMFYVFYDLIIGNKTFLGYGDATMQTYAWLGKIWNSFHNAELALWDFNQYGGTSFAGEIQTAPFYFGNILFALFANNISQNAMDIYIFMHYLFGAFSMFGFLKYNKHKGLGCIIGAMVFACIGTVSARAEAQPNIFFGYTLLPIVVLLFQMGIDHFSDSRKRFVFETLSGLFLGNMILAGHMQPYIHATVALGLFAVLYGRNIKNVLLNLGQLVYIGLVSVIISFGQIVCGLEYMNLSYRWIGLEEPVIGFAHLPEEAYDFAIVKWEYIKDIIVFSGDIGDACTLYISLFGLLLAVMGIISFLCREEFNKKYSQIRIYAIITSLICIILSFGRQNFLGHLVINLPAFSSVREPARILYVYNFSIAILTSLGITWILELIDFIKNDNTIKIFMRRTCQLVFAVACIIMISRVAFDFNALLLSDADNPESAKSEYDETEVISYLINCNKDDQQGGFIFRYVCDSNENTLTPNLGSVYPMLYGLQAHRATMPISYYDLLNKFCWDWNGPLAEKLGIKYFISNQELDLSTYDKYDFLTSLNGKYIYQNKEPVSFIHTYRNEEITSVVAQNLSQNTNSISFEIDLSEDDSLGISMLNYPGWKAEVDNNNESIITDEDGFIQLNIGKGKHNVKLYYDPWWIKAWIGLVLLFFTCSILVCIYLWKKSLKIQEKI